MHKAGDGIPDSALTAPWRPGDGPRRGYTSMQCYEDDCQHRWVAEWTLEYGQMCYKNEDLLDTCPECGSENVGEMGDADPPEPDWDLIRKKRLEEG